MYHVRNFASLHPDKPAAIFPACGCTMSFAELEAGANQAANAFKTLGVVRGDCVALSITNRAEFLTAMLGAQRIGAFYVLLSTKLSPEDVAYIVKDADASVLVMSEGCFAADAPDGLSSVQCKTIGIGSVNGAEADWHGLVGSSPVTLPNDCSPGRVMLYSSGTTGRPKGIRKPLPEGAFDDVEPANAGLAKAYEMGERAVLLSPSPLYHAAPHRFVSAALHCGSTVVIHDKFDAAEVLRAIGAYSCTHSLWVPTMFHRFLQLPAEVRAEADVGTLKYAVHGAAPCPPHLKRRMIEWWGPILDEYYSGSEGVGATRITSQEWLLHQGSVGKPNGCNVHILGENGEELPIGATGEVYFSEGGSFEYWKDPEKTKSAVSRQGWRTFGDIGHIDTDGYLYLTDRKHFTINSGGVNIYPQEIESALLEHPAVFDVAVIGVPDETYGEIAKAVVQLVDVNAATSEMAAELRQYVRSRLGPIKTPRSVDFQAELPRHATGKLYKSQLIQAYRNMNSPPPERSGSDVA